MAEPVFSHTCEIKQNQEDAERVVSVLRRNGWDIYHERVPLSGQVGYYCVRMLSQGTGTIQQQAHSVRWNLFREALVPLTIDCRDDAILLSFLWEHSKHENFSCFEYDTEEEEDEGGDVGFVCYCHGLKGYSLALHLSYESDISDAAREVVIHCLAPDVEEDDDEDLVENDDD